MIFIKNTCRLLLFLLIFLFLTNCGYNKLVSLDEAVAASWSEIINQYQRRSDLIPNLVQTVKGYAKHEKTTLTAVIEARAKATSMQVNASQIINNPEKFQQFTKAQSGLTSALSRLMVVAERYPDLKASSQFTALQSSLEGTENRIAVSRKRFIESVRSYNTKVRAFPSNLWAKMFNFEKKANFAVDNLEEVKKAPSVSF